MSILVLTATDKKMLFIDLDLIKNLEELPEKYIICQDYRVKSVKTPLQKLNWPLRPFVRLLVNYCEKGFGNVLVFMVIQNGWR